MNIWSSITSILGNSSVQSFLISCGASITWDTIKFALANNSKEDSFHIQVHQVFADTFRAFYQKYNLEFDEEIVMTSFWKNVGDLQSFSDLNISKKVVCDTLGMELTDLEINDWKNIFKITCSHPQYQWIYNKLALDAGTQVSSSNQMSWAKEIMKGNYCKIACAVPETLPPVFEGIETKLSEECWYDTQVLLWEIIFNACEHGNANNCSLVIKETSISVIDDGKPFNALLLEDQHRNQGGSIALRKYKEDYSEIELQTAYWAGNNHFTLEFGADVFEVNGMSEIIVPALFSSVGCFKLRYPDAQFRYYYIDMDEIPRTHHGKIFASYSGIFGLINKLNNDFRNNTDVDKIFIYFSDLSRTDYKRIYDGMQEILSYTEFSNFIVELIT